MNLREYNQKMMALLVEICELEKRQAAIHTRVNEIEEASTKLRFEYVTDGDVL